jgi:hypothetical protein
MTRRHDDALLVADAFRFDAETARDTARPAQGAA